MTSTVETQPDPLLSGEFQACPEAVLARLREEDPVHLIPGIGAWFVTRHEDVKRLFAAPELTPDRRAYAHYRLPPAGTYARWIAENSLFAAPPDQHARQRKLVSAALTPRAVRRQEQQVLDVVEQFAAPLRGRKGVVDLTAEYTSPIPATVIGRITGVPPKGNDEERFRELAREVISGVSPFLDDEGRRRAEKSLVELCSYIRELIEERRRRPKADLVSDLVQVHDAGDKMTNEEIILMVAALVAAGTETTAIASTTGIHALLHHRDQLERLRADRSLLPSAVNELLRYAMGSFAMPRYAATDFELHGKKIEKGQLVLLSFMGAHRDSAVYSDPDRLDVTRDPKDLVIFGHGAHFCLGANLARQELRCIYDAALDFLPSEARVIDDQVEITRIGMFSRMETLPIDFGS